MTDNKQLIHPVVLIDSGFGGLSVWREINRIDPRLSTLYLADQAHVPYGSRPLEEVRGYAFAMSRNMINQGARVIVLASNTTSAAALYALREAFPHIDFVGMEPALKPAIESTKSGVVGVLATAGTFQGQPFARLMDRYASDVEVITQPCRGWVEAVESGDLESEAVSLLVEQQVRPLLEAGADQLVLGCTHYPFLRPLIERLIDDSVTIVDPAISVARQTVRIIMGRPEETPADEVGSHRFLTSASVDAARAVLRRLLPGMPFSSFGSF